MSNQPDQSEGFVPVDVNDVIEHLLQLISGQVLQIAKLEALNKKLLRELEEKRM